MTTAFEELEKKARALSPGEKASLAHILIVELDSKADPDAEEQWLAEAQRRYDAYTAGQLPALPGEEVMERARARLK